MCETQWTGCLWHFAAPLCDGQQEEFARFYAFCKKIGLPTSRRDICASEEDIRRVFKATEAKQDVGIMPYKITQDMLHEAADKLEKMCE